MRRNPSSKFVRSLALVAALALGTAAYGHVLLLDPNGGEVLQVGSTFTVKWQVTGGNYNPLNWDLWYSTAGAGGPWLELAYNLPAGSGANGSIHTYDWTVSPVVDDSVWVRVRMDNAFGDFLDVSNGSFSIVPKPGDLDQNGFVGVNDLLILLGAWGACPDPCPPTCTADVDGDCLVGVTDLLIVLANWDV